MSDRNKSEAIRKLLTAVPDIRAKHAREILAEEGIGISLDLFRVVRSAWRKNRRELEAAERRYKLKAPPPPLLPDDIPRMLDPTYSDDIPKTPDPAPPERDHITQPPPPLRTDDIPDLSAPEAAPHENDSPPTDDAACDFRFHDRIIDSFSDSEWTAIMSRHNQAQDEESLKHEIAFWGFFLGLTPEESIARLGRPSDQPARGEEQRRLEEKEKAPDPEDWIGDGPPSLSEFPKDEVPPSPDIPNTPAPSSHPFTEPLAHHEEIPPRNLSDKQLARWVRKARQAFDDDDWRQIEIDYRRPGLAEQSIAEEILRYFVRGCTPEQAVEKVITELRDPVSYGGEVDHDIFLEGMDPEAIIDDRKEHLGFG